MSNSMFLFIHFCFLKLAQTYTHNVPFSLISYTRTRRHNITSQAQTNVYSHVLFGTVMFFRIKQQKISPLSDFCIC